MWCWYRPANIPLGITVLIPVTLLSDPQIAGCTRVANLIAAAGLDARQLTCWSVNGMMFEAAGNGSALLEHPLPVPPSGDQMEVSVWLGPIQSGNWTAVPTMPASQSTEAHQAAYAPSGSGADAQHLDAIAECWNGVAQLEVRVGSLRKELTSAISRLNSLNRDLNSDERRLCDSKDVQEWSDARRWLRDSISSLSKSLKEIDIGTTSGAGRRNEFQSIYQNYVSKRIPFPGLAQTANEFETYRKILQSLMTSAQSNITKAGRDGESRANSILQRIGQKVRSRRR